MNNKRIFGIVSVGVVFTVTLATVTSINLKGGDSGVLPERRPEKQKQVMLQAERASIIPSQLGPLDLLRTSGGPEAMDRFVRFSGRQIPMIDAVFAEYEGTPGRCRLWIGWMPDSTSARRTLDEMRQDALAGETPFSNVHEGVFDGLPVFEFSGLSQKHAYLASGRRVVWLSADEDVYRPALLQLLNRLSR